MVRNGNTVLRRGAKAKPKREIRCGVLKSSSPEGPKQYLKLIRAKFRHPNCFVRFPFVSPGAKLGRGCSVSRGVEVGEQVVVGDYSYLNCGAIVGSGSIGRFCSIGPYAMIGLPEHPLQYLSTSPVLYGMGNLLGGPKASENYSRPPLIGSDVWIGAFAVVRQGVHVGHGAVIGAGAVVTRDVDAYQIVAGVPARPIRQRFDSGTIQELLQMRWWERSTAGLQALTGRFLQPQPEWTRVSEEFQPL